MPEEKRELTFLSYAHDDLNTVRKVYAGLKKRNVNIWFDKEDMTTGRWKPQILRTIPHSKYFIFCVSNASIKKTGMGDTGFVDNELQIAWEIAGEQDKESFTIIPVRLEDCDRGDKRLSGWQQYDLFPDFEKGLDKLAVDIGGVSLSDSQAKDERTDSEKLVAGIMGKADMFYYSGEYEKALAYYDSALEMNPDDKQIKDNKKLILNLIEQKADQKLWHKKFPKRVPPMIVYTIAMILAIWILWSPLNLGVLFENITGKNASPKTFLWPKPTNEKEIFSRKYAVWWEKACQHILIEKGMPTHAKFGSIWAQHFEKGRVLYNHGDGEVFILFGMKKTFIQFETVDTIYTSGPGESKVNWDIVNELLKGKEDLVKKKCTEFVKAKLLLGGIGTLYMKHNLYQRLGKPLDYQYLERDILISNNDKYVAFIGVQNRQGKIDEWGETKCVIVCDKFSGTYSRHTNSELLFNVIMEEKMPVAK